MKSLAIVLSIIFLSSCSSYLTSSENVSETKNSYAKVLVVGRSKDRTTRIRFEKEVVSQFMANGVQATASYGVDGLKALKSGISEDESNQLKNSLTSKGFDGVVVTNLVNTETYTDVIPGNSVTTYMPVRYGRFGRHIGYYPVASWEPDQLKSGTKYIFESSFYNLSKNSGDNLEWVGRFELKNPTSIEKTAENYAKELVNALVKSNIAVE